MPSNYDSADIAEAAERWNEASEVDEVYDLLWDPKYYDDIKGDAELAGSYIDSTRKAAQDHVAMGRTAADLAAQWAAYAAVGWDHPGGPSYDNIAAAAGQGKSKETAYGALFDELDQARAQLEAGDVPPGRNHELVERIEHLEEQAERAADTGPGEPADDLVAELIADLDATADPYPGDEAYREQLAREALADPDAIGESDNGESSTLDPHMLDTAEAIAEALRSGDIAGAQRLQVALYDDDPGAGDGGAAAYSTMWTPEVLREAEDIINEAGPQSVEGRRAELADLAAWRSDDAGTQQGLDEESALRSDVTAEILRWGGGPLVQRQPFEDGAVEVGSDDPAGWRAMVTTPVPDYVAEQGPAAVAEYWARTADEASDETVNDHLHGADAQACGVADGPAASEVPAVDHQWAAEGRDEAGSPGKSEAAEAVAAAHQSVVDTQRLSVQRAGQQQTAHRLAADEHAATAAAISDDSDLGSRYEALPPF